MGQLVERLQQMWENGIRFPYSTDQKLAPQQTLDIWCECHGSSNMTIYINGCPVSQSVWQTKKSSLHAPHAPSKSSNTVITFSVR